MKIVTGYYMDGGTVRIRVRSGEYFIDHRIGTDTPGTIYDKYPDEPDANIVETVDEDVFEALNELIDTLRSYNKGEI